MPPLDDVSAAIRSPSGPHPGAGGRADVLAGAGGYIGNTVNLQRGQTRNFCDNLGRDL